MLTFLSQWVGQLLDSARGRTAQPRLRALPGPADFNSKSNLFQLSRPRPLLRVVGASGARDSAVAPAPVHVGATAFVAGQGARIYSLDAFRSHRPGPHHPRAA